MTPRDRKVLIVLGVVAALAGFWFLALQPKRDEAAAVGEEVARQEQRLADAQAAIAAGEAARERFADDYATVARLGKAVPVGDQTPSLLYQLERTADRHRIDFRSMKLRAETSAAPPAAAPAKAVSSGAQGGGVGAGAPPATQATAAVAPPGSAVGAAGFPTMPFTFKFDGSFFRMERFLAALERFTTTTGTDGDVAVRGRLLTVDAFSLMASKLTGFPDLHASVMATAYVVPPAEGSFGGATAAGPAARSAAPAAAQPGGDRAAGGSPAVRPGTAMSGGIVP